MDNKVKNAYLTYYVNNSPSEESYISVSGAEFATDEFAFDIWFNISESGHVLVSQKNGFTLGIDNNKIIFKHPSMKSVTVKNDIVKIPNKVWTNLYMGYDKKELVFYINGVKFGAVSCSQSIRNSEDFLLGEEFTGYIRSFRLYGKTIAESDFKSYCFAVAYDEKKMPNMAAFLDLTDKNIPDLSGHGVNAYVQGGSTLLNMVDVYRPSAGKYASFSDSSEINPGGFASGEFSVYTKLHIRPSQKTRHIITANGSLGDSDSVVIFADGSESGTAFGISIGGKEYSFQTNIGEYNWVDVIFTAKGKQLTAYINGVKYDTALQADVKRTQKGNFKIGGCTGASDQTCEHYLHTVAVFDRQLGEKDAADFMENHPFILEDGLVALVGFDGCGAYEYVKRRDVFVDSDDLFSAVRTVSVMPDTPYEYRVNYTKEVASKMKAWEAKHLVEAYQSYGEEIYGFVCCASPAALTALTAYLSHDQEVLNSIAGLYAEETVTAENIATTMGQLGKSMSKMMFDGMGFAAASGSAAASTAAASAASVGDAAASTFAAEYFRLLFRIGTNVVIAAANVIANRIKKSQEDKPDDDDDKNAELQLISITLQHNPDDYTTSAVRCRNCDGVISGAEWTKEKKCVYPAVYIADQIQKPKIKVKFKISEQFARSNGTCKVTLSASVIGGTSKLFGSFKYEKSGLTPGREYEAELESSTTASVAMDFSYEQIELWWSGMVDEDAISIPNTKVDVYVIPTTPCLPISMDKDCPKDLIAVEYLHLFSLGVSKAPKMAAERQAYDADGFTKTNTVLYNKTMELYNNTCLQYEANYCQYITWVQLPYLRQIVCQVLVLNETQLLRDMGAVKPGGPKLKIQCDIYAAILHNLFNAMGVSCRFAHIINPIPLPDGNGELDTLHVRGAYPAGGDCPLGGAYPAEEEEIRSQDYDFNFHMIVAVSPQRGLTGLDGVRVYDASMGVKLNGRITPLADCPFYGANTTRVNRSQEQMTYRGLAIQDGTGAIITSQAFGFAKV